MWIRCKSPRVYRVNWYIVLRRHYDQTYIHYRRSSPLYSQKIINWSRSHTHTFTQNIHNICRCDVDRIDCSLISQIAGNIVSVFIDKRLFNRAIHHDWSSWISRTFKLQIWNLQYYYDGMQYVLKYSNAQSLHALYWICIANCEKSSIRRNWKNYQPVFRECIDLFFSTSPIPFSYPWQRFFHSWSSDLLFHI